MPSLIERAKAFAHERHEGQFRKGDAQEPYIVHVEEVAGLVAEWGGAEYEIAAAWLHDTVEDCPPTSFDEIEELFGREVAALVREMTDDKSLPKAERKELQVANAPKKSAGASLIKIADKCSNVAAIGASPPAGWTEERRAAYLEWAQQVVESLSHHPTAPYLEFRRRMTATREALQSA